VQRYQVSGVPKTVLNEKYSVVGALAEEAFVAQAVEASKERLKAT
jgi:predicted DsbA family dithiol-disulfide isomerase